MTETTRVSTRVFQFTHPGRGATFSTKRAEKPNDSFNSRTPGGVRLKPSDYVANWESFNSRTPGGVRQCGAKLRIMGRINKRNLRLEVLL